MSAALFKQLPNNDLQDLVQAARVVSETMRVMQKSDSNVVAEILKTEGRFREWDHIPADDVYDRHSHGQYFYHAHSKTEDGTGPHDDEHGHFHTFIRGKGFPEELSPVPLPDFDPKTDISDMSSHLIGISMDKMGVPMRLFTVNRWVTGETWYAAEDLISVIDTFEIDDVRPSWPLNLWITNMVKLYKPMIIQLIMGRDEMIDTWTDANPDTNVFEDRTLELTSSIDINLATYVTELDDEFQSRLQS